MQAGEAKRGAIFFVTEAGVKTDRAKLGRPLFGMAYRDLPFEFFFVARSGAGRRSLRRDNSFSSAAAEMKSLRGSGNLGTETKEAAGAAEVLVRGVVERILLEDAPIAGQAHFAELSDQCGKIRDADFDFDLANGANSRHGKVSIASVGVNSDPEFVCAGTILPKKRGGQIIASPQAQLGR